MTAASDDRKPKEKKQKREFVRLISVASTVGIQIVLSTLIGFGIGYYLDEYLLPRFLPFSTSPWLTIIFMLIGIAAGFTYLFKVTLGQQDNGDSQEGP